MRIEILADVKTTLGEGPLWDVDEQRLYWIDSFDGRVFRCTADGRELRAWDVPQKIGSMALRKQAGGGVAGARFSLPGFSQRRGRADRRSRARQARQPAERRQGRPAGALLRRQHGHAGSRTQRRPYRLDPDLSLHRLDTGIVVSNGPCWSGRQDLLFRRHLVGARSGPMTAIQPAARFEPPHLHARGHERRRRGRRLHGGRRGLFVERPGLRRQAGALRARRQRGPRHRDAGQEGHQRDVRRPGAGRAVRHVHGQPPLPLSAGRRGARQLFALHGLGVRGLPEPRFGG